MSGSMVSSASPALPDPSPGLEATIADGAALPVLDLGPYLAGESGAADQLAADIRAIQIGLGFYAVINHGIPTDCIAGAEAATRQLFRQPRAELDRYRGGYHLQGYWPPASTGNPDGEFADEAEKVGSLAGWAFLRDRAEEAEEVRAGLRHRIPNRWPAPSLAPGFREALTTYQRAMVELGMKLVPVYALALGLDRDVFAPWFRMPEWYQRCNYYRGGAAEPGSIATVAHIDHSFLTLLPMSTVPGLEVRTHGNRWMPVSFVEGAIIVNTGEWLNLLSNGLFRATPHRVTEPASERITLPLFLDPDDAMPDNVLTIVADAGGDAAARPGTPRTFHQHFVRYLSSHYTPEPAGTSS